MRTQGDPERVARLGEEILSLRNVWVKRASRDLLAGVDWTIQPGQHWAVLGPNGSGKTTLLNVVTGYLWATEGSVAVLGQQFGQVDIRDLRRSIGWVSASLADWFAAHRAADSALAVVESGRFGSIGVYEPETREVRERARQLLAAFRAEHLADAPFRVLSQGERQRVLLARAWMADPSLLILDEPCTGLDLPMREALLTAVQNLAESADRPALIYVTHHPEEIVPAVSHVLLVQRGAVMAAGAKREVLTAERLEALFGLSLSVRWEGGRPWVAVG